MVFAVWSGVTYASTCLVKWSWKTKTLAIHCGLSNSIIVSILVKSTCRRSRGAVATMGHKGALGVLPSYWRQHLQPLITCLICLAIPGPQKHSCNRERYGHSLGALHLNDIHLGQQFDAPWVLQIITVPHSLLLGWSRNRGYLGGMWSSGGSSTPSGPPHSLYTPQEVSSDQPSS